MGNTPQTIYPEAYTGSKYSLVMGKAEELFGLILFCCWHIEACKTC